ncbi:MAG: hypothetical protein UW07_C0040G0014, partial [Candidatus Nomurabacteria bacterium GW2011_GWF2_43_8]
QHPVHLVGAHDGHAEVGAGPDRVDQPLGRRSVLQARAGEPVTGPDGAALPEGAPADALAGLQHERAHQVGVDVQPAIEREPALGLVVHVDAVRVAPRELGRLRHDEVEEARAVEAGGELAGHMVQLRGPLLTSPGLRVQAALLERHREVLAERGEGPDARGADRPAARLVVGADRADHALARDERRHHEPPRPEDRVAAQLRGDRRHALEVLVREDGDGAALLHGLPEGAGRRRVRDTAGGGFPGFPELPDELEVPAARRQEEDPDAVEAEDVVDGLHERVEAVVALPGRLHREPGLVEPLEELAPLLALAEQPRLLDGDRRLVRERQQHGDLVRPEAARGAGVDVQVADHAVLRYREPVYKNIRELALSYFHEYFLDDGKKTLRQYSELFDLSRVKRNWITALGNLWWLDKKLDRIKHYDIAPKANIKKLRQADRIEIKAGKIVEWKK